MFTFPVKLWVTLTRKQLIRPKAVDHIFVLVYIADLEC